MRNTIGLGLTTLTFLVGLAVGAIDSRTAHVVVAPAHALPKGGGGGSGGCDGKGTPASCASCSGGNCIAVCVGAEGCVTWLDKGGRSMCLDGGVGCASGGSKVGGISSY
jgi:hypothetical protein